VLAAPPTRLTDTGDDQTEADNRQSADARIAQGLTPEGYLLPESKNREGETAFFCGTMGGVDRGALLRR